MGSPAAKQGDMVVGIDTHIVMVPSVNGQVPTPLPHPFSGQLDQKLSSNVKIDKRAAATVGSIATNQPKHIPTPPGVSFQAPPANQGPVVQGSSTVFINKKAAARAGDPVQSCDDLGNPHASSIVASSTVLIG
jgi:PAAR motif